MMRVEAEPRRYTGFAEASGFDSERMRPLTESGVSAVVSSADAPDGLDWQTFTAAHFPGQGRHHLDAIAAYGAYRGLGRARRASDPGRHPDGGRTVAREDRRSRGLGRRRGRDAVGEDLGRADPDRQRTDFCPLTGAGG